MQPHQRDVTQLLAAAVQSCHDDVCPSLMTQSLSFVLCWIFLFNEYNLRLDLDILEFWTSRCLPMQWSPWYGSLWINLCMIVHDQRYYKFVYWCQYQCIRWLKCPLVGFQCILVTFIRLELYSMMDWFSEYFLFNRWWRWVWMLSVRYVCVYHWLVSFQIHLCYLLVNLGWRCASSIIVTYVLALFLIALFSRIVTYVLALFEGFSTQLTVFWTERGDSDGVHPYIVTLLRSDYWIVTFFMVVWYQGSFWSFIVLIDNVGHNPHRLWQRSCWQTWLCTRSLEKRQCHLLHAPSFQCIDRSFSNLSALFLQ